jgi:hypothetical protein
VARGVGEVEGWPAVASVAGLGVVMLVAAGVLLWRARSLADQPRTASVYRGGAAGSQRASNVRGLAVILLALCVVSQLLYTGLYVEVVRWLLGATEPPWISGDLFFWVVLVDGTCVAGALLSGLRNGS